MSVRKREDTRYVVGVVTGAHFVSHLYLLAYPPLFPLLGPEFDVTTTQLGLIVTAIYVPTLLIQLPLGELVDRIGAKRVLAAGMVVTSMGITLSGLAPTYRILLAFAFVSGVGQSVFHPADYALLETVTEREHEGKAFSTHTFGGFAGFAAAPALIGGIAIPYGWRPALLAVGSIGFVYAAVMYLTTASVHSRRIQGTSKEGDVADGTPLLDSLSFVLRAELILLFCFYLVSMMAIVGLQSFTTVFAVRSFGFDEPAANTVLTAYLAFSALGVIGGGPLADALPAERVIVATFVLSAAGVGAAVIGGPNAGFLGAVALFSLVGLCTGAALPSRDKLANSFAEAGATGRSFGFFFTGLSLGAVISPALLGFVIDAVSIGLAFLLVGGFLVLAAAVAVAIARPAGVPEVDVAP